MLTYFKLLLLIIIIIMIITIMPIMPIRAIIVPPVVANLFDLHG